TACQVWGLNTQQNFQDEDAYYQFSRDECDVPACPFGKEEEWKNGVRLLAHMVPYVQSRTTMLTLVTFILLSHLLCFSYQRSIPESQMPNDEVNTVRMKERGQDALVLKKVSSASPAPTAGSAQNDWSSQMDHISRSFRIQNWPKIDRYNIAAIHY
uniref:Uncharacterized protein n=1 Tax=Callorhinchus milii TaxID=7868 RepID=A0A4W3JB38_CALMI